ncbi:hypothetical protein REPUB_Repub03eG0028000 [Reevesia pubescens]
MQAVCTRIKSVTEPIFEEYIGKFQIEAIEFDNLSLGTLPFEIHGIATSAFGLTNVIQWDAPNLSAAAASSLLTWTLTLLAMGLVQLNAPNPTFLF